MKEQKRRRSRTGGNQTIHSIAGVLNYKLWIWSLLSACLLSCNRITPSDKSNSLPTRQQKISKIANNSIVPKSSLDTGKLITEFFGNIVLPYEKKSVTCSGYTFFAYTQNDSAFHRIEQVFHYGPKQDKLEKVVVIFGTYYRDFFYADADQRELYSSHGQGASVHYGLYTVKNNKEWELVTKSSKKFNNLYDNHGVNGGIYEITLIQYGSNHFAFDMSGSFFNQGSSARNINYYDFEKDWNIYNRPAEMTSGPTYNDNEYSGDYSYDFKPVFSPSEKEYWSLKIVSEGTKMNENEIQIEPYHKVETYHYDAKTGLYLPNEEK